MLYIRKPLSNKAFLCFLSLLELHRQWIGAGHQTILFIPHFRIVCASLLHLKSSGENSSNSLVIIIINNNNIIIIIYYHYGIEGKIKAAKREG